MLKHWLLACTLLLWDSVMLSELIYPHDNLLLGHYMMHSALLIEIELEHSMKNIKIRIIIKLYLLF